MAKSKSLTVLTVVSSIFALQACSEGITSADEALANLSNQTSSEATDPSAITLGAATPAGTETTIPITPSVVSNYIVNNISVLPLSSSPSSPDEDLEPGAGTPTDIDPEVATDPPSETDPEEATDLPSDTDPEEAADLPADTDPEEVTEPTQDPGYTEVTDTTTDTGSGVVTEVESETEEKEVASVDFTPILEAPSEGELVPFGSTVQFAWSIPVALLGTVTGFDIAIADASEGVISYRDNGVTISSCSDDGLCTHEVKGADLPIAEGENIWSVSSLGENGTLNIAEATFTLDKNPDAQTASGLSILSPAAGYVADSSSVDFAWADLSKPDAVYDLHVYSDAARTQKVTGTNGVIFDTQGIGTANNHTFYNDPSDGAKRYGLLLQWEDTTYNADSKKEILFEYTSHKKVNSKTAFPDAQYDTIKNMVDAEWPGVESRYTMSTMESSDGYFASPILHAAGLMSRTTGDRSYMDVGIRIGQSYIDSGSDFDNDGYLDWNATAGPAGWNKDHHEWRAAMGLGSVLIEMKRTGYTNGDADRIQKWHNFLKKHVWEKWQYGHDLTYGGFYLSNIATKSAWFSGRFAMVALALDYTHATPGNNEWYTWLNSTSSSWGQLMNTYIAMISARDYAFPATSDNSGTYEADTSHINDAVFPMFMGKMLGHTFNGKVDTYFDKLEQHLNYNWFPTAEGWRERANGNGAINGYNLSHTDGLALVAALSPSLKARYVDHFLNHEPVGSFYESAVKWPQQAVWQGAGLLWALSGGEL